MENVVNTVHRNKNFIQSVRIPNINNSESKPEVKKNIATVEIKWWETREEILIVLLPADSEMKRRQFP